MLFFESENYRHFLDLFKKGVSPWFDLFSYCLMPNHFHLFGRPRIPDWQAIARPDATIQSAFKHFFMAYAKAINKRYKRTGALFQQKYKRKPIETEDYFTAIVPYIHLNPVRAGLCFNVKEWPYSSYNALLSEKPTALCRTELLQWYGGKEPFLKSHTINNFSIQSLSRILYL